MESHLYMCDSQSERKAQFKLQRDSLNKKHCLLAKTGIQVNNSDVQFVIKLFF